MSKKVKTKQKTKVEKKEIMLMPVKPEEKSLVVVEKKKLEIAKLPDKEVFKKVVKTMSLALIGTASVVYVAIMALVATSIFYVSHLQSGLIQKGVYVNGINVSDMSEEDAVSSLASGLNDTIPESIILKYKENTYPLNLNEMELKFDIDSAAEEAYSIGRTQNVVKDLWEYAEVLNHTVNIESNLVYQEDVLNHTISQIVEEFPEKVQEYTYTVENNLLTINPGKSGVQVDTEALKQTILANLKNQNYDEIEIPTYEVLPKDIDVQAIHDEIYKEPQDAYYIENPITIYPEVIGVDFDVQNAQTIINSNDAEQYIVELTLTNPNVFVKDLNVFPDTLSTFGTKYVNNANRTTNLILASSKISGTVIMPGESFSFNKIVGERTIAAGYKNAAIFVNGQVEDGLAGGICQVSSTLYNSVVGANLQVTERHNHSKLTSYLPGGKDATVVWGRYDFQFVNNRAYPVKIEMNVQGGVISANIYGIKSNEEYEISIESARAGSKGAYSIYHAYKVYRQNGVEVKREFLSTDYYK